jgi:hypothetical protein
MVGTRTSSMDRECGQQLSSKWRIGSIWATWGQNFGEKERCLERGCEGEDEWYESDHTVRIVVLRDVYNERNNFRATVTFCSRDILWNSRTAKSDKRRVRVSLSSRWCTCSTARQIQRNTVTETRCNEVWRVCWRVAQSLTTRPVKELRRVASFENKFRRNKYWLFHSLRLYEWRADSKI